MIATNFKTISVSDPKYTFPDVSDVIIRKRLFSVLETNSKKTIFLIMGQAAQGKSTLIASYLRNSKDKTIWLHLDKEDSDQANLFHLILNAFHHTFGNTSLSSIGYSQVTLGPRLDTQRHREILKKLLTVTNVRLNIVMDNMDSLDSDASCLELIHGILKDMRGNIHFFLISRSMPHLHLGIQKLQLKGKLFILNNWDLAFTIEETKNIFKRKQKFKQIDDDHIKKIHAITEGWAGGLTLIAESVNTLSDITRLSHEISAKTVDFFAEEIFSVQPEYIRDFLVKASFFKTIDPDIIAELYNLPNPLKILSYLEKRNLFIQKLEQENNTPVFRLNQLFRDFLFKIFKNEIQGKEYKNICTKAGEILQTKNSADEAINYFIKAGAWEKARQAIKKTGTDLIIKGRLAGLSKWIESMPVEMVWQDPWLIYYLTMTRRISGGNRNIDDLKKALSLFMERNDDRGSMLCIACLIETAVFLQKPGAMIKRLILKGEELLASIKDKSFFTYARAVLYQQIGFGHIAGNGNVDKGISACKNARILAIKIKNKNLEVNASIVSILGYVQTGSFHHAEKALTSIKNLTEESIYPEYRALKGLVNIDLLLKKGDFDKADTLLTASEKDIEKFGLIFLYPWFVENRAMYYIYKGNYIKAEQLSNHLSDVAILAGNNFYQGIALRIRGVCFYHRGDIELAGKEAEKAKKILFEHRRGDMHLFLAKKLHGLVLMHLKQTQKAIEELEQVVDYFTIFPSTIAAAGALSALGLALWADRKEDKAEKYIIQGMDKVEQSNYTHFMVMNQKDFVKSFILSSLFKSEFFKSELCKAELCKADKASDSILHYISSNFTEIVRSEIKELISLPWVQRKKQRVNDLRALFRCTIPMISINTLGGFSVLKLGKNPHQIKWKGNKPILILKSLILHGGAKVPKDIIIEDIWPESSEDSGERKFKINLHRLRKTLEPDIDKKFGYSYIQLENGYVSFDPDLVTIDYYRFLFFKDKGYANEKKSRMDEALLFYKKASELYKGDLFSEEPYTDWISQDRNNFKNKYIGILKKKVKIYQNKNQTDKAIGCLEKILETDPLMESAYQQIMVMYAKLGMHNHVLQIFQKCKETIQKEIGSEPDVTTLKIYNKIKDWKNN